MQRPLWRKVGLFAATSALVLLFRPAGAHVRAVSLLSRFTEPNAAETDRAIEERAITLAGPRGDVSARLYLPRTAVGAPGIVLVHGVHQLGIDEPRLVRFARTIASSGVVVMTPEIAELRDYHIDPRSIDTIGVAARALEADVHRPKVGVMGLSFGGGLALLAAADARFRDTIAFVVAVGAHDDLGRVSRYFATSQIEDPDGHPSPVKPHAYGPLVLVYDRAERFFPVEDVPTAKSALLLWLWEKRELARAELPRLSAPAREKMERLFDGKIEAIAPELLAEIDRHREDAARVSPHGHLEGLQAAVYLLHGAGDSVIPSTETLWLAHDVPPSRLRDVLVSPAVVDVDLEGEPTMSDKWALVHFMADVLSAADGT